MRSLSAALFAAALVAAAAACDVCSGLSLHEEPATAIVLPATGDLASCACAFVFAYSAGPTPGKITLAATPGVGAVAVYGDAAGTELIAELPESAAVDGVVIHSRTGTIRVDVATVASPAAGAAITLSSTAINTAPVIEEREGLDLRVNSVGLAYVLIPWSAEGDLLPVTVRDYDNFDRGLRAELELEVSDANAPILEFLVPYVPGLVFEEGAAGALSRRVVVSGPGGAVEAAVNNARLVPIQIAYLATELLQVTAYDLGSSGEGGEQVSGFLHNIGVRSGGGTGGADWSRLAD